MSLKEKTIKGVTWSFVDNFASQGITFLVGIILARLLSPEEFGIIGMTAIFIAISNSIVDSGFSNALIRKTDTQNIDYNTVFYFNFVVGIVAYAALYFGAPSISIFFGVPSLVLIIRVVGIVILINALAIIHQTILVKKIDFKTRTKISVPSSIIGGIVGVGMAFWDYGVWSLVGMQLARQLFHALLLWFFVSWRPMWQFSKNSFKELFNFGYKLLLSGLIDTIYRNIFHLIIGRFYSAFQLGQYTRAEQFSAIFSSNLTGVIQRVSYPVLSTIQDDPERLKSAFRKVVKIVMFTSFTCMLLLAAVAEPLLFVLIGEKWALAVAFLQIICFSAMLFPLHALNLNILQVKGRSDLFLKLEIIKKMIAIVPILLGIFGGIKMMLWGSVGISVIAFFVNSYYTARLINYSASEQLKDIFPSFVIAFSVAACLWTITLLQMPNYIILLSQGLLGIVLIISICETIKLDEYFEIKQIIFSRIKQIKK